MSRRIKMLRQVNERLFLYFEVPRWNGTSRSNLCNAQKLADDVRAYFADEGLWQRALFVLTCACYLVPAMTTIARAMLFSSSRTLEITIYNQK